VTTTPEDLPDDIAALQAALVVGRAKRIEEAARAARVEAELAVAKAKASDDQAVIAHQQLQIAKLTRQLYGQRSERTVRLLDQMELALEELESSATEEEIAAERAVSKTTNVVAFTRKRPARQPFSEHLPRERVIEPRPTVCLCCGSPRLRKLGEDITETLEVIVVRLAGRIRRRRCSTTRGIGPTSMLRRIWPTMPDLPGRRLRRIQQAVRGRPQAGPDRRGGVLGPCPATLLPDGRSRCHRPAQGAGQNTGGDLASGAGGGPAH